MNATPKNQSLKYELATLLGVGACAATLAVTGIKDQFSLQQILKASWVGDDTKASHWFVPASTGNDGNTDGNLHAYTASYTG